MAISNKIQSITDSYGLFVLEGLIGTKGTSKSDVIGNLLREWMNANKDFLAERKLSDQDFQAVEAYIVRKKQHADEHS